MRILVACDSFKDCCSASTACQRIASGLGGEGIEADVCPLADGGEGTLDALGQAVPLERRLVNVLGPLGDTVTAELGWLEQPPAAWTSLGAPGVSVAPGPMAIVESAQAIGLGLVLHRQRNPMLTTSYGLGQLIGHARRHGARSIVVGLGGSATVDGGIGMAQALGVRFDGISDPASGKDLSLVSAIEALPLDFRRDLQVFIASDVKSPLLGAHGAAMVFGPQKGATPRMVAQLERTMAHYASLVFEACRALGFSTSTAKEHDFHSASASHGAGAAGGIGFALQQLFGATTISGVDWVMQSIAFDERLGRSDLVITGEGQLDESSFEGKVVSGVILRAQRQRVPVAVICGQNALNTSEWASRGIARVRSLTELARDSEDSKSRALELLQTAAADVIRFATGSV